MRIFVVDVRKILPAYMRIQNKNTQDAVKKKSI